MRASYSNKLLGRLLMGENPVACLRIVVDEITPKKGKKVATVTLHLELAETIEGDVVATLPKMDSIAVGNSVTLKDVQNLFKVEMRT